MKMHQTNKLKIHSLNSRPLMRTATPDRVRGAALYKLKHAAYVRDGGRCCMCGRTVELQTSQLDHRIALRFCPAYGLTPAEANSLRNLWTLCTDEGRGNGCHEAKTQRENKTGQACRMALAIPAPVDPFEGRTIGIV